MFRKILYRYGHILDNIQFQFGDVLGPKHGSNGGGPGSCEIDSDDYIVKVGVLVIPWYGPMTRSFSFITRNGKHCSVGIQYESLNNRIYYDFYEASAPSEGYYLAYMSGNYGQRYNNVINVRLHWKKC